MKKTVFSGIQPTGAIHLGNYLGAIRRWIGLQDKYSCVFSVVDLHALTVYQDPKKLRRQVLDTAKILLALGINPEKSILFVQSDVPQHLELFWILNSIAKVAELELMTQYKDKAREQHSRGVFAGFLNYPVLMAADILLYDTSLVPVGEDQRQHLELARELTRRFNEIYGKTFKVPEALIEKEGAKIMGLDDPYKKMSKSSGSYYNYIALTDEPDMVRDKIKKAVTDSETLIKYDPIKKPGVSNLLTILALATGKDIKEVEDGYFGENYGKLKLDTADAVIEFLSVFQKKFKGISDSKVESILKKGTSAARKIAQKKIDEVYKKVGIK
jgi:tryptophanyl-tRNA synthetase